MSKSFIDLKNEWVEGLEEAKADGDSTEYLIMTFVISAGVIIVAVVVLALLFALLKAVFWPLVIGVGYTLAAKAFGWPTPLDIVKKVVGK